MMLLQVGGGKKGETCSPATYVRSFGEGDCDAVVVAVVNFIYHLTFFTLFMPLQSGG